MGAPARVAALAQLRRRSQSAGASRPRATVQSCRRDVGGCHGAPRSVGPRAGTRGAAGSHRGFEVQSAAAMSGRSKGRRSSRAKGRGKSRAKGRVRAAPDDAPRDPDPPECQRLGEETMAAQVQAGAGWGGLETTEPAPPSPVWGRGCLPGSPWIVASRSRPRRQKSRAGRDQARPGEGHIPPRAPGDQHYLHGNRGKAEKWPPRWESAQPRCEEGPRYLL